MTIIEAITDTIPEAAHSVCLVGNARSMLDLAQGEEILQSLKDRHKGKRCWVVGGAESLRNLALDRLKGEILFGSNLTYRYYKDGLPEFTYYHIGDPHALNGIHADLQGKPLDFVGNIYYRASGWGCCISSKFPHNQYILSRGTPYSVNASRPSYDGHWSGDIMNINYGPSIVIESLAFAIYMGFAEIYIIGCDCKYPPGSRGSKVFETGLVLRSHGTIAWYCKKRGILIANAGESGILEAYPKIKFMDAVGKQL